MKEDRVLRMMKTTPSRAAFVGQLVRRHLKVPEAKYKVLLCKTEQRMKDSAHILTSQTLSEAE
eukprot:jgi/Astpho2/3640/Aster-07843